MSRGWKIVLDESAVEYLLARRARERQAVIQFLEILKTRPNTEGDFVEHDDTGRPMQIKVHGRHAFTFWADHALQEVRIIEIEPAD